MLSETVVSLKEAIFDDLERTKRIIQCTRVKSRIRF